MAERLREEAAAARQRNLDERASDGRRGRGDERRGRPVAKGPEGDAERPEEERHGRGQRAGVRERRRRGVDCGEERNDRGDARRGRPARGVAVEARDDAADDPRRHREERRHPLRRLYQARLLGGVGAAGAHRHGVVRQHGREAVEVVEERAERRAAEAQRRDPASVERPEPLVAAGPLAAVGRRASPDDGAPRLARARLQRTAARQQRKQRRGSHHRPSSWRRRASAFRRPVDRRGAF
mmetsp:Transcript_3646/g.13331  ORF Transcript_3646/g.13331 Transcript_3646/m.13331 type:complete len:239 (+) Transcript_3646:378-1094(+)